MTGEQIWAISRGYMSTTAIKAEVVEKRCVSTSSELWIHLWIHNQVDESRSTAAWQRATYATLLQVTQYHQLQSGQNNTHIICWLGQLKWSNKILDHFFKWPYIKKHRTAQKSRWEPINSRKTPTYSNMVSHRVGAWHWTWVFCKSKCS